jgi:glycosyltransferase involved in cell wall biosynthesis
VSGGKVRWVVEDANRTGGVEAVLRALDAGLRARGIDSTIVEWLPVEATGPIGSPFGWLRAKIAEARRREAAASAMADRLREDLHAQPDLVAVLEPGSLSVARHLVGAPRWGIHVHRTPDLLLRPWRHLKGEQIPALLRPVVGLRMLWIGRQTRRLLGAAPFVVSLTPSHTRVLTPLQQHVEEIPNPVAWSMSTVRPAPRVDGVVTIGYVGRLSFEKGPDVLIEALDRLDVSTGPRRTWFAGTGPEETSLRNRVADLGLDDVSFLGWVDDPRGLLAQVDVLVLPSRAEAVPLVLVEALASGCVVVAADAGGGVRDVLGGGQLGDVVPAENPAALASAIGAAVERARRGRRADPEAVAQLVEHHRPARVLDTWVEFLQRAVRG